jgi:radical SAM protein with 4Fe4S-binding SPASM domain
MKEDIWKKVIDEGGKNELYSMKFTYRGEPLLHKDLPRMVAYAKESGIMDVYFNTNAVLLTEKTARNLINAGLDRISISFEGFDKKTYEKYRVGSNFELVVGNVIRLKEIKKELGISRPLVRIQTVLAPEMIGREKEYTEFWTEHVDEVAYLDMKEEEGNPDHRGLIHDWACHMLWQRMCVAWDGTILPCVHDIYSWMHFGNIAGTTVKEAWNSEQERRYRDLNRLGRAHEIPSCDRCPLRHNEICKLVKCG